MKRSRVTADATGRGRITGQTHMLVGGGSVAVPTGAARTLPRRGGRALAIAAERDSAALLVAAIALAGVVMLALLPYSFLQDSWLALVAGREVWVNGLPHSDTLTAIAGGSAWVDQQWLSQLMMYGLWRLGGLGLVGVVHIGLLLSAVAGACAGARRLGASAQSLMRLLPLCLWAVMFGAQVRTQAYAYPLFIAVVYLLAADSRSPSRRTYWCLALLVVWANLHGSVTLGAGLVVLRGVTIAWERRGELGHSARAWIRPATFILGPLLCLGATPYGTSIASYYHGTLLDSSFRSSITEWQPVTSIPFLAAPLLILAAIALWSFGRHPGQTTLWERCALLMLAIAGISAVRNVDWFAIAGLMIVALSIDSAVRGRERRREPRRAVNGAIALAALLALIVSIANAFSKPARSFEPTYPLAALGVIRTAMAADPALKVLGEDKYGDWLLWHEPQLRGRVAYDARFELLGSTRLHEIAQLEQVRGVDWKRIARGYRLVVIDATHNPESARGFTSEPDSHTLYDHGGSAVILRSAGEAAS